MINSKLRTTETEKVKLLEEIEKWKYSSGLMDSSGDPDGITPELAEKYWLDLEKAAKEALIAIDILLEEKPMLSAKMTGFTTFGNIRANLKGIARNPELIAELIARRAMVK